MTDERFKEMLDWAAFAETWPKSARPQDGALISLGEVGASHVRELAAELLDMHRVSVHRALRKGRGR